MADKWGDFCASIAKTLIAGMGPVIHQFANLKFLMASLAGDGVPEAMQGFAHQKIDDALKGMSDAQMNLFKPDTQKMDSLKWQQSTLTAQVFPGTERTSKIPELQELFKSLAASVAPIPHAGGARPGVAENTYFGKDSAQGTFSERAAQGIGGANNPAAETAKNTAATAKGVNKLLNKPTPIPVWGA
jgi:hypothetical protein